MRILKILIDRNTIMRFYIKSSYDLFKQSVTYRRKRFCLGWSLLPPNLSTRKIAAQVLLLEKKAEIQHNK